MNRSSDRILTTHVGSLPYLDLAVEPSRDEATLRDHTHRIVERQRAAGLDIINEGEYTKGGDWLSYMDGRLSGFEARPPGGSGATIARGRDREEFADFYAYAAKQGSLFYLPGGQIRTSRPNWVCTGPVGYQAQVSLRREIDLLRGLQGANEAFLTSTAPASLEPYYADEFYHSESNYLYAFADAMREEYEAIVAAGLILQVDDAWLPALWDRIGIPMGLEPFRARCGLRIEALNHALANVPEERVRYHFCWGSWHGPHVYDIEMRFMVDLMLRVKAQAYSFEAANARHEHEYAVWETVKLPEGKIIIPGVVTHSTDVVEHPELVAQRLARFARLVGRENVIAGADCGFGGRTHQQIAWAKLSSLVEGAALASRELWK
ncbi:MAG: cobalamin-independent methionine synthase II family protein [Chloroflexota bacterium]